MSHQNLKFKTLFENVSIIPVLVIENIEQALPLANTLLSQGYRVIEVTLRTDCALDAVRKIANEIPQAVVGVGTVTSAAQFAQAQKVGAQFAISPGATPELITAAENISMPYLPGIATASEAMALYAQGYRYLKLFPSEASGGISLLKSLNGPLPDIKFCPTGGINAELAQNYLQQPNVTCVGGSWMT